MAINKTINKRTNTHGAMRNCIEYVLRQDKTSEQFAYIVIWIYQCRNHAATSISSKEI